MHSLRKWFYRPKKEDSSKLALFYWADEELTIVASELDSFDGRTDPDRCSILVSQLRICQDKVLSICNDIMDDAIPDMRANRDFRAKFPDDVLHENLAGQLWFGAECLAAGSNIIHRELESASMRPLAKALSRALDNVRCLLREQSLKNAATYSEKVREALRIFDRLFAEFELCYVGAMVPIKSAKEYHLQQEIVVLFSETLIRALKLSLVTQDMIDDYDPSLMFTIPRLAIVWGLLLYPDGPFNVERESADLSELFRPFCNLLFKIRDLLWTLTEPELHTLEKMLCSQDEPRIDKTTEIVSSHVAEDYVGNFYQKQINCKQFIHDFYAYNFGTPGPESVPERSDGSRKEECHSNNDSKRSHSSAFELGVEFGSRPSGDLQGSYHKEALEVEGGEIKALRSCNVVGVVSDSCEEMNLSGINENNKEVSKEGVSENPLMDNSLDSRRCRSSPKQAGSPYRHSTSSLEDRLSRLHHNKCTCPAPRDRLTPSRELMRQVMRQVEIVPLGQRVTGYGSSPDNSQRAFHHGILSHSFPANGNIGDVISLSKEVVEGRPRRRGPRKNRRQPPVQDCDIVPATRGFYTSNSNEVGSHWDPNPPLYSTPLAIPRLPRVEDLATNSEYSSCSSCQSVSSVSSAEWDSTSPDTSSYNSECQDDEEIALALQAAEIASRNKARSRFKSSGDLLHKLFVCISGVADQLQTNYASDLRNILKSVFDMNCTKTPEEEVNTICDNLNNNPPAETPAADPNNFNNNFDIADSPLFNRNLRGEEEEDEEDDEDDRDHSSVDSAEEAIPDGSLVISELEPNNGNGRVECSFSTGPPEWIPDELSSQCMACKLQFTILRRRHHCRNCGKIFCSRCSSNTIPLPRYGHLKPVRVCNQCFMYQLTNLVMQRQL